MNGIKVGRAMSSWANRSDYQQQSGELYDTTKSGEGDKVKWHERGVRNNPNPVPNVQALDQWIVFF